MEKKYRYLRTVSIVYKLLAILIWGVMLISIAVNFVKASRGDTYSSSFGFSVSRYDYQDAVRDAIIILSVGGFLSLGLLAAGQIFDLFIDMEENTRASRYALMQLLKQSSSERPVNRSVPSSPPGPSKLDQVRQNIQRE